MIFIYNFGSRFYLSTIVTIVLFDKSSPNSIAFIVCHAYMQLGWELADPDLA